MTSEAVDLIVFGCANFYNVALTAMFIARARPAPGVARAIGTVALTTILPLALALSFNLWTGRVWWTIVLPALLLAHLSMELLFDYILQYDFRRSRWLGPYLLVFYLGSMGLIGYTFQIGTFFGFVTLATYFLNLGATWYSYSRVGHGQPIARA